MTVDKQNQEQKVQCQINTVALYIIVGGPGRRRKRKSFEPQMQFFQTKCDAMVHLTYVCRCKSYAITLASEAAIVC